MASQNLYAPSSEAEETVPVSSFQRVVERHEVVTSWGPRRNHAALPYDITEARKVAADKAPVMHVTTNRVMAREEAKARLDGLIKTCGVGGMGDEVQYAFHKAMLLAHAVNSASTIQPGRAVFKVGTGSEINFWTDIVQPLGPDVRRFFRVYADMTRDAVQEVLDLYATGNDKFNHLGDLVRDIHWVAGKRGLRRFPTLIADSADACTNLTDTERAAVDQASATIFANQNNVADMVQTHRVRSAPMQITNHVGGGGLRDTGGPDY
jgi:hypothetical protein